MSTQTDQLRESIWEVMQHILTERDHNEPLPMPRQDDIIKRAKEVAVVNFYGQFNAWGRLDAKVFIDWINSLVDYFSWRNIEDPWHVTFAKMKLKGLARNWWKSIDSFLCYAVESGTSVGWQWPRRSLGWIIVVAGIRTFGLVCWLYIFILICQYTNSCFLEVGSVQWLEKYCLVRRGGLCVKFPHPLLSIWKDSSTRCFQLEWGWEIARVWE